MSHKALFKLYIAGFFVVRRDDEWKDIIMTKDLSAALSSCRVREREDAGISSHDGCHSVE